VKKVTSDDELLELLRRGSMQAEDLDDDPSTNASSDPLQDDLDELVLEPNRLREQLGLRRK
jgi:hypothetical protein